MDLHEIMSRFSQLTGLEGPLPEAQRQLCLDALAELTARRKRGRITAEGKSLLEAAAAAVACRRHLLLCIAAGGSLTVGDARVGEGGPVAAAAVLEAECLYAASPWLRSDFVFRRTEVPHGGRRN